MAESVFISYARSEQGSRFAEWLRDQLDKNGYDVWLDRAKMPSRGRSFLQEIRDAIEASDRLILVVDPRAAKSAYVKTEWSHALLFGKVVVCVLREGTFDSVPSDLANLHCVEFQGSRSREKALDELLRVMSDPGPRLAPYLTRVPSLPPKFVAPLEELHRISDSVLADVQRPSVAAEETQVTTLHGMGGTGKSVLATAFARATETRRVFGDGVLWVEIGQDRPDLLGAFRRVATAFKQDLSDYTELSLAIDRLPDVLQDKNCLIVLDDVRTFEHAAFFHDVLGPRCRLLVTTRDRSVALSLGGTAHALDVLDKDQPLTFLARSVEVPLRELPQDAAKVASRCGGLVLALALCGAHIREGGLWDDLLSALQDAELDFLDHPQGSVLRTIKVGVDALDSEDRCRYLELAAFARGAAVPESAARTLWAHTGGLQDRHTRKLLMKLGNRSLLRVHNDDSGITFSLHDLQHDFLTSQGRSEKPLAALLDAYDSVCPGGWHTGPDDGYFFNRIAWHLHKAGRSAEIADLLLDVRFLKAKLEKTDVQSLVSDYAFVADDPDTTQVRDAIQMSAGTLDTSQHLVSQLLGRLMGSESERISRLLSQARESQAPPWLEPLIPCLRTSGDALRRTLPLTGAPSTLELTADERQAVCGTNDGIVTLVPLESSREPVSLKVHRSEITSLKLTADGRRAVSGSADGEIKVWETAAEGFSHNLRDTGEARWVLALTGDETRVIGGSADGKVSVWDLDTGRKLCTIEVYSHAIAGLELTKDGKRAICWDYWGHDEVRVLDLEASQVLRNLPVKGGTWRGGWKLTSDERILVGVDDNQAFKMLDFGTGRLLCSHRIWGALPSLRLTKEEAVLAAGRLVSRWNLQNCEELRAVNVGAEIVCFALVPDGRCAITDHSGELSVWDLQQRRELHRVRAHSRDIRVLAMSGDGGVAVTGGADRLLKTWSIADDASPKGAIHPGGVSAIAFAPERSIVVSGGREGFLSWRDLESGREMRRFDASAGRVESVRITMDGEHVIVTGVTVHAEWKLMVWSANGELVREIRAYPNVTCFESTRNGKWAVAGNEQGRLTIWNLQTGGTVTEQHAHHNLSPYDQYGVTALALTRAGDKAVTGGIDGRMVVWDVATGASLVEARAHPAGNHLGGGVSSIRISEDGAQAVTCGRDALRVWDLASGQQRHVFETEAWPYAVELTQDGRLVAGGVDGTLRILDLQTGRLLQSLQVDSKRIDAVFLLRNGAAILNGSVGGLFNVWDLEAGVDRRLDTDRHAGSRVKLLAVDSDGRHAVGGSEDGLMILWDLETGDEVSSFQGEAKHVQCSWAGGRPLVVVAGDVAGYIQILRFVSPTAGTERRGP